ncbi:MAG: hypothetical protein V1704_03395 [Candidatus Vogelbacteria bacterium]
MTDYHPVKVPRQSRRFRTIFIIVLFFVVLLGLSQGGFRRVAVNISGGILSPFWTIGRGMENFSTGFFGLFTNKIKLATENAQLRNIINQQATALLNKNILELENTTLKQIMNRAPDPLPLTIGRFLNGGQQFPLGQATIDVGAQMIENQLVPGTVVISAGSVVLGELTEIYGTKVKMRFYSSSGERLLAQLGETHTPIELTGRGAGNFIALLPRDLAVAINDQVTLAIAGREFVLAIVNDIQRTAGNSFQEVFLRTPVNISQLVWVEMYAP